MGRFAKSAWCGNAKPSSKCPLLADGRLVGGPQNETTEASCHGHGFAHRCHWRCGCCFSIGPACVRAVFANAQRSPCRRSPTHHFRRGACLGRVGVAHAKNPSRHRLSHDPRGDTHAVVRRRALPGDPQLVLESRTSIDASLGEHRCHLRSLRGLCSLFSPPHGRLTREPGYNVAAGLVLASTIRSQCGCESRFASVKKIGLHPRKIQGLPVWRCVVPIPTIHHVDTNST
jgi:hypothetical protein